MSGAFAQSVTSPWNRLHRPTFAFSDERRRTAGPRCVPSPRHRGLKARGLLFPTTPQDGFVAISSVASSLSPSEFPLGGEAYHTENSRCARAPLVTHRRLREENLLTRAGRFGKKGKTNHYVSSTSVTELLCATSRSS